MNNTKQTIPDIIPIKQQELTKIFGNNKNSPKITSNKSRKIPIPTPKNNYNIILPDQKQEFQNFNFYDSSYFYSRNKKLKPTSNSFDNIIKETNKNLFKIGSQSSLNNIENNALYNINLTKMPKTQKINEFSNNKYYYNRIIKRKKRENHNEKKNNQNLISISSNDNSNQRRIIIIREGKNGKLKRNEILNKKKDNIQKFKNQIFFDSNYKNSKSLSPKNKYVVKENTINVITEPNIIINNGFVNMNNNYYLSLNQENKNQNFFGNKNNEQYKSYNDYKIDDLNLQNNNNIIIDKNDYNNNYIKTIKETSPPKKSSRYTYKNTFIIRDNNSNNFYTDINTKNKKVFSGVNNYHERNRSTGSIKINKNNINLNDIHVLNNDNFDNNQKENIKIDKNYNNPYIITKNNINNIIKNKIEKNQNNIIYSDQKQINNIQKNKSGNNKNKIFKKSLIIPQIQLQMEIERINNPNYIYYKTDNNNKTSLETNSLKEKNFSIQTSQEFTIDKKNPNENQYQPIKQSHKITERRRPLFKIPPSKKRSVSQGKPLTFIHKYYDENFILEEENEEDNVNEDIKNQITENKNSNVNDNTNDDINKISSMEDINFDSFNIEISNTNRNIQNNINDNNLLNNTKNIENIAVLKKDLELNDKYKKINIINKRLNENVVKDINNNKNNFERIKNGKYINDKNEDYDEEITMVKNKSIKVNNSNIEKEIINKKNVLNNITNVLNSESSNKEKKELNFYYNNNQITNNDSTLKYSCKTYKKPKKKKNLIPDFIDSFTININK